MKVDTNEVTEQIKKGFEMFDSTNTGLIDPHEFRDIMDSMNLKEKNPFIYNIIISLCQDEQILEKGGIAAEDLIYYIDEKLNDNQSEEGIKNIFHVFSNSNSNTVSIPTISQIAKEVGDNLTEQEIKNLIDRSQLNGKELNFEEFYNILKIKTNPPDPAFSEYQKPKIYIKKSSKQENNVVASKNILVKKEIENQKISPEKSSEIISEEDMMRSKTLQSKEDENGNKTSKLSYKRVRTEQKPEITERTKKEKESPISDIKEKSSVDEEPAIEGKTSGKKHYRRSRENKKNNNGENEDDSVKGPMIIEKEIIEIKEVSNKPKGNKTQNEESIKEQKSRQIETAAISKNRFKKEINEQNISNKDSSNEEKGEPVSNNRRYHRRYRETKTTQPEDNNNGSKQESKVISTVVTKTTTNITKSSNSENNNDKKNIKSNESSAFSKYKRKK